MVLFRQRAMALNVEQMSNAVALSSPVEISSARTTGVRVGEGHQLAQRCFAAGHTHRIECGAELGAADLADDAPAVEHVHPVAVVELFELGAVPNKAAPGCGFGAV